MTQFNHNDLLRNAMRLDAKLQAQASTQPVAKPEPAFVPNPATIKLPSTDPFGGNVNNAKAAQRRARAVKQVQKGAAGASEASDGAEVQKEASASPVGNLDAGKTAVAEGQEPKPATAPMTAPVWNPRA